METGPDREQPSGPVLLYDEQCGFCDCSMRLLLRLDRRRVFRVAPLDGDYAAELFARRPDLRDVDSMVLVEDAVGGDRAARGYAPSEGHVPERVSIRSTAVLRVVRRLGGGWRLFLVFALVPRPLRDWAYDVFARHRGRLFALVGGCPLQPPDDLSRLLD